MKNTLQNRLGRENYYRHTLIPIIYCIYQRVSINFLFNVLLIIMNSKLKSGVQYLCIFRHMRKIIFMFCFSLVRRPYRSTIHLFYVPCIISYVLPTYGESTDLRKCKVSFLANNFISTRRTTIAVQLAIIHVPLLHPTGW